MLTLTRKYHFYAAHRNEQMDNKCRHLHGHTYYAEVSLDFGDDLKGDLTIEFSEADKLIKPFFKKFDHGFIVHEEDPIIKYLKKYENEHMDCVNMIMVPWVTSLENLSRHFSSQIYREMKNRGYSIRCCSVTLVETTSGSVTATFPRHLR